MKELELLYQLIDNPKQTVEDMAIAIDKSKPQAERYFRILKASPPEGFGMNIIYIKGAGYSIKSYGVFGSKRNLLKEIKTS